MSGGEPGVRDHLDCRARGLQRATVAAEQLRRRTSKIPTTAMTVTLVLATGVTAAGATRTIVEIGHSGAKATCNDIPASDDH
jgi:hypothetical protein